jgi:Bacterial TSP3 repeat
VQRFFVIVVSLGLAIAGVSRVVVAQESATANLSATDGNAAALGTGAAEAAPGSVTHGDTSGIALLGPDGTYNVVESSPPTINVSDNAGAPPPVYEPAPEPVSEEPVSEVPVEEPVVEDTTATDTAVASDADLDGDNLADNLEWDLGLDPTLIDTDGDGVADGDEINIYGTDPTVFDSDGDSIGDGDELYNLRTAPLVWDTDGNGIADGADTQALSAEPVDETAAQ